MLPAVASSSKAGGLIYCRQFETVATPAKFEASDIITMKTWLITGAATGLGRQLAETVLKWPAGAASDVALQ